MPKQFIVELSNGKTSPGLVDMEEVVAFLGANAPPEFWQANTRRKRMVRIYQSEVAKPAIAAPPPMILVGLDQNDKVIGKLPFVSGKYRQYPNFNNHFTRRQAKLELRKAGAVYFVVLDGETQSMVDIT